jgi:microcystin-dependent protein
MSEIRANSITDAAGTGAPNFPNGATSGGVAVATATEVAAAVPAGSVVQFARNTAPTGWLKANGAAVSRTTYATLFAAIGTTFGVGDGSTTFNLPDLRGYFSRNWDDGRGIDSGRAFGSAQTDEFKSHNHGFANGGSYRFVTFSGGAGVAGGSAAQLATVTFSAGTGTETRPLNIALLACIKF